MTQIFENAIVEVTEAYPSIFTKDDVVKLINKLKFATEQEIAAVKTNQPNLTQEDVNNLLADIREGLLEGIKNLDIADFVTLELDYNHQIDINVDTSEVCVNIAEAFDLAAQEYAAV